MLIESILAASLAFSAQADVSAVPAMQKVALSDPSETQAKDEEELDDANKRVCRRMPVIGSRMKKKVCASKKEWEEMSEASRNQTDDLQRRGQAPGSGIGG
ncbi:hypothetical protein EH31_16355 [Erythrobacter longus]|uniref:Uncharacterized protein n=1 Tax=Erythrobacter longus TaxID=1044 RepID=A0A074M742_ERYLO|nr:hypothetical protein [Erythrobacter longus]KEO88530.1 hypothetical protein EH31_16355 [Erythrobacter longus]